MYLCWLKLSFYYLLYKTEHFVFPKYWQIILIVHYFIEKHINTHTHTVNTHVCMQIQGSQLHLNDNIIKQDNLTEEHHITILFV